LTAGNSIGRIGEEGMMARMTPAPRAAARGCSDAAIIARSLEDPDAFSALFERHFAPVQRWLHRRVGGQLAEDLAAETFTRAFDGRGRFDTARADAAPWLFGIANNLVHDHRRTELRRLRALARTPPTAGMQEDVATRATARADAAASGPALAAALAGLREQERDVVLLVAWAALDYEDVARALGVPVGTVRSRLHRARQALRAALNDEEDEGT
jgi:RNA polymerase sigma-70 factor (ECF subfamily)